MTEPTETKLRYAGLFRRLFAICYDCFLLIAILFIVSGIATALNDGRAVEPGDTLYPIFVVLVFGLSYLYFSWFWTHGGQTLGMRSWKLQLRNLREGPITWLQVLLRIMTALPAGLLFGLGYLWMLVDRQKLTWHDRYSETCVVQLEENPHKH